MYDIKTYKDLELLFEAWAEEYFKFLKRNYDEIRRIISNYEQLTDIAVASGSGDPLDFLNKKIMLLDTKWNGDEAKLYLEFVQIKIEGLKKLKSIEVKDAYEVGASRFRNKLNIVLAGITMEAQRLLELIERTNFQHKIEPKVMARLEYMAHRTLKAQLTDFEQVFNEESW